MQLTPQQLAIKGATRRAIDAVGGLEAAATFVRLKKSHLHRCCSVNEPTCFAPLDVAQVLDEHAGYPYIAEQMLKFQPARRTHKDPHELLSSLLKEAGELGSVVSDALADGRICPREATAIIKEATDLKEACQRLIDMASTVQARAVA